MSYDPVKARQNYLKYKEYYKQYYQKNREKITAKVRDWAAENHEKVKTRAKKYYLEHKEEQQESRKAWRDANAEACRIRAKLWGEAHKDDPEVIAKRAVRVKKWREENLDRHCAKENKRRAAKLQRTPKWVEAEEMELMQEVYAFAKMRERICGGKWHVDHFFPLQGKEVSGLHTIWNLRVIPGKTNVAKSAKLVGQFPTSFF